MARIELPGLKELLAQWREQRKEVERNKSQLIELLSVITELNTKFNGSGFKDFVKLQRENATASKELATQTEQVNIAVKEQERLEKALITQIERNKLATEGTNRELIKQRVQTQELNKELKQQARESLGLVGPYEKLSRELIQIRKRAKDAAVEFGENSKQFKELQSQALQVSDRLKGIDSAVGQNQRNVGNYSEVIEGLFPLFGRLQQGLGRIAQTDVSEGLPGLTALRNGIAGATKAALAFIATPIGAAIAAFSAIGLITKEFLDYNESIKESLSLTEQLTGLSGRELGEYRASVAAVADVFEQDFNEVLKSSNSLARNFGLEQRDALNLVQEGLSRGLDLNGDFLNQLEEYPSVFRNIGFSADEFLNIIAQSQRQGIFDDKVIDAVKEADLALKEFTKTQEDALNNAFGEEFTNELRDNISTGAITTAEALQVIGDEADKNNLNFQQLQQLTADVFKGAGEDAGGFARVLQVVNDALDEEKNQLTDLQQAQQEVVASQRLLNEAQDRALNSENARLFQKQLEIFVNFLKASFFDSIAQLREGFSAIGRGFSQFRQSLQPLIEQFPELNKLLNGSSTGFLSLLASLPFAGLRQLANLFSRVGFTLAGLGAAISEIRQSFVDFGQSLSRIDFSSPFAFASSVRESFGDLKKEVGDVGQAFEDGYNRAQKASEEASNNIVKTDAELAAEQEKLAKKTADQQKKAEEAAKKRAEDASKLAEFRLQEEIKSFQQVADAEDENLFIRLQASDSLTRKQIELAKLNRDEQLKNANLTADGRKLIEEKFASEIEEINRKSQERLTSITQQETAKRINSINNGAQSEATASELALLKEIENEKAKFNSKEAFEKRKQELIAKSAQEEIQRNIDRVGQLLEIEGLSVEQREALELELAKLKSNLSDIELDQRDKSLQDQIRIEEQRNQLIRDGIATFGEQLGLSTEAINAAQDIFTNSFKDIEDGFERTAAKVTAFGAVASGVIGALAESSQARFEQQLEANDEAREQALENESLSAEQREFLEEKFAAKRAEIQRRQAESAKRAAIIQATIDTATAVIRALATFPAPNIPAATIAGAFGAAQIALIASQPVPQFATGVTDSSYEGLAIKDEIGAELHFDKKGNLKDYGQNKGAKYTYVEKGDTIVPALESKKLLESGLLNSDLTSMLALNGIQLPSNNVVVNNKGITETQMRKVMKDAFKNQPRTQILVNGVKIPKSKNHYR